MKKTRKFIYKNKYFMLGFVFALLIVYYPFFFEGFKLSFSNVSYTYSPFDSQGYQVKGPLLSDPADHIYPVLSIMRHKFSLWSPLMGFGSPFVSTLEFYFFILNYLYILPLGVAIFLVSASKFFIGFLGMYLLLREYRCEKGVASIGAITYTFSSNLVMWHGWPHSSVAMLAPFLFLLIEKLLVKVEVKYFLLMIFVVFQMAVVGMPTYAAYFFYLLGIYTLIYGLRRYLKTPRKLLVCVIGFVLAFVIGGLMSVPSTGILVTSVGEYANERSSLVNVTLSHKSAYSLILPYLYLGEPKQANEYLMYTGLLFIFMLPLSFIRIKRKPRILFYLISIFVITILMYTNLLTFLYKLLPFVGTSLKIRNIVLFNFCGSVLVALNLNDIVVNREEYIKKKGWFVFIFLSYVLITYVWMSRNQYAQHKFLMDINTTKVVVVSFLYFFLFLLVFNRQYRMKTIVAGLIILSIYDMGSFTQKYLPYIEKSATVIPQPTDTIEYLQENTRDGERVTFVGIWNLFPSTNLYYGLKDIRAHDFVMTNSDIKNYLERIDEQVYTTPTRTAFNNIENIPLLQYASIKYIVDVEDKSIGRAKAKFLKGEEDIIPLKQFEDGLVLKQEVKVRTSSFDKISFFIATFGERYTKGDLVVEIADSTGDKLLRRVVTPLKGLQDNTMLTVEFPRIEDAKGETYVMSFYLEGVFPPFALYGKESAEKENDIFIYIADGDRELIGDDGLVVEELIDTAPIVQLTDHLEIKKTQADVLEKMADKYQPHTLFIDRVSPQPQNLNEMFEQPLSKDEKVLSFYQDIYNGDMTIETQTNQDRVLLINEYYDKGWKAYVDGEETEIFKGNYLFKYIVVPSGTHKVTLKYEPKEVKLFLMIFSVGLGVFLLLIIFRNKIQKGIDLYTNKDQIS